MDGHRPLKMIRLSRNLVLAVLLLVMTGGHWALLQSAAWAGMLASHLRTQSLHVAVSQTFDGQHPCCLCKAIQKEKGSDKKPDVVNAPPRFDLMAGDVSIRTADERCESSVLPVDEFSNSLTISPLLRPPRATRI